MKKVPNNIKSRDAKWRIIANHNDLYWNLLNSKWDTKEKLEKLCDDYCDYLRSWMPWYTFKACCNDNIRRFMTNFPEIFSKEKIEEAKREWQEVREKILFWCVTWKINGRASGSTLIFALKNKFPAHYKDKQELEIWEESRQIILWLPKSPFMDWTLKKTKAKKTKA